ncbi:MAG: ACT domain-containing protein [Pseudomonadota bacterium]
MAQWHMLTLVGTDRPGIVAEVTAALYQAGNNLGEASMIRLGGSFTIMLMIQGGSPGSLQTALAPIAASMNLNIHVDPVAGGLHQHQAPNVQVRVFGADRAGIVAQVTGALAATGFNILELTSDVAGSAGKPVYILHIEGLTTHPVETLQAAIDGLGLRNLRVDVSPIETLIG